MGQSGLYVTHEGRRPPKYYFLTMLPYPSGDLHIGHWYAMAPSDARARFMRMRGYNVLFPMGFDAFGLPAENAAIKRGIHPKDWTCANIDRMRGQLRSMGAMWIWDREAVICRPGVLPVDAVVLPAAVQARAWPIARCRRWTCARTCNTTLAREQVWGEDRHCERCGTPVIKKDLEQWFFKTPITPTNCCDFRRHRLARARPGHADQLDRPQRKAPRWYSRPSTATTLEVFTTRPDTLWGATFMVLAPEHPLVDKLTSDEQRAEVEAYVSRPAARPRSSASPPIRRRRGVFTGGYAINPVNGERIPIWIADYVLMTYGTGAIMAVPGAR